MYSYFANLYLNRLVPSLQNVPISMTITQETIAFWIKLETKGIFADKTIRTTTCPILWNSFDDKIRKSLSTKHIRNLYKSPLISSYVLYFISLIFFFFFFFFFFFWLILIFGNFVLELVFALCDGLFMYLVQALGVLVFWPSRPFDYSSI